MCNKRACVSVCARNDEKKHGKPMKFDSCNYKYVTYLHMDVIWENQFSGYFKAILNCFKGPLKTSTMH